jgi:oligopeptide/dipeptide ABC transporter ATP-binding protein
MLVVRDLSIKFKTKKGIVTAVRNVSFDLKKGETLGVVGESGCGKSITNMAIMGLLPPEAIVEAKELSFNGKDLKSLPNKEWQLLRGDHFGIIFQDPMSALNPCFTVEFQLAEVIAKVNPGSSIERVRTKAIDLLDKVGIPDPKKRLNCYPHELSGGMAQRVMIAMAIAGNPDVLIADEPTTALDVTIQLQILKLLKEIQKDNNMAILFVTHDLGVVSQISDRIQVLYAGEIVEEGPIKQVLTSPHHPYTQGLLNSLPKMSEREKELYSIKGTVPGLGDRPPGCQFAPRCDQALGHCSNTSIKLKDLESSKSRCVL